MTSGWDWQLSESATADLATLDREAQEQISAKLDEIVDDRWREPDDYLEPLTGVSHSKLRIGPYRLGCRLDRDRALLLVGRIGNVATTRIGETTDSYSRSWKSLTASNTSPRRPLCIG